MSENFELPQPPSVRDPGEQATFISLLLNIVAVINPPTDQPPGVRSVGLGFLMNEKDGGHQREFNWRGQYVQELMKRLNPQPYAELTEGSMQRAVKKTVLSGVYWEEKRAPNHSVTFSLIRDDPDHPEYSAEALRSRRYTVSSQ